MIAGSISRRGLIGAPILLAGCHKRSEYFGNTHPPSRRILKFALGPEPDGLDPATFSGGFEVYILPSLLEGLISYDPHTLEPSAALATHYEVNRNETKLTFFLRGHHSPRGIRLPSRTPTLDSLPAHWTDGTIITALDFVYSWQRLIDPTTAAPFAYVLYYVRNAHDIQSRKKPATDLGVRAVDGFTFEVELERPCPLFLKLTGSMALGAVPRQAIEAAKRLGQESQWVEPSKIVSSGAFRLKEWRRYERLVLERNPAYYDAGMVWLDEVHFFTVAQSSTIVDLYRAGEVHSMPGERIPVQFTPLLEGRSDFHVEPAVFGVWANMNTRLPPCNDPMVRYAINMAVDKQGLAKVLGSGRLPARGFVPPMQGYPNPERVEVEIGGRIYNVLEHNPEAARALLAASRYGGSRRLKLRYLSASLPLSAIISLFLRQQLEEALGAELAIDIRELNAANRTALELSYEGLTDGGDWGTYVDPSFFLDRYVTGSGNNTTGWEDPLYDALIADANSTLDAPGRLRKQAECEKYALAAMPNVPLWYNTWSCLQKPFVHGLPFNLLDLKLFKYAWIDSNWRAK